MNHFKKLLLLAGITVSPFLLQQCCRDVEQRNYVLNNLLPTLVDSLTFATAPPQDSMDFADHAFRVWPMERYVLHRRSGSGTELMALTYNCPTYYRSLAGLKLLSIKSDDVLFSGMNPGDSLQQFCEFKLMEDLITKQAADRDWGSMDQLLAGINKRMQEGAKLESSMGMPRLDFVFRFKKKPLPGRHSIYFSGILSNGDVLSGGSYAFSLR
ncbi:MAG: hypothetical protein KJS92_06480 [Bacteroidetes bacterium]|nr:hypothetical protein [Bacteroidota bacterium]